MSDDLTGSYLKSRGEAPTSFDALMASQPKDETDQDGSGMTASDAFGVAKDVAKDVGEGIIEAPRQFIGGAMDATKEMAQLMEAMVPLGTLEGGDVTEESFITTDEARSTTGGLIRGVGQFVSAFIPVLKGVKVLGVTSAIGGAAAAGAVVDAVAFDPLEDRLSNLIEEFPALSNPVTRYLQADEDDTRAEGMFKNAVEGLGLGALFDTFTTGVRILRANRIEKRLSRELIASKETATKLVDGVTVKGGPSVDEFIPFEETASKASPDFKMGAGRAADDAAANINLNNIETTAQVDNLINKVAEVDAPKINEARREVITLKETEKLADDLGLTVAELLDRRKGQAFNAEQAVAARKILVSSGENLFKIAQVARTGSDADTVLFARALSQHRAIQAQVSGLTAEAGRALSSFRIHAKTAAGQARAIDEALVAGGGVGHMRQVADRIAVFENVNQLNTMLKDGASIGEMFYEVWINGLLSSPATHSVNVMSNSMVVGWSVGDRMVASAISNATGDGAIHNAEVVGQLFGIVQGGKDGMKAAWKVIKTGEVTDPLQKIESAQFRSITAENLHLSGTPGQFADFIGEVVRLPGRALMAGDELFKSIGYRMELNAQAFRTAKNEGLQRDALSKRITDIIRNPPENIDLLAIDAARYQTFTNELGPTAKKVQGAINAINDWTMKEWGIPSARIIVPFIRTPTNIMKYVGVHTPLAPLTKNIRKEIMAGGARRDLTLAKIATGSMTMALAADYAMSGNITGGGPRNTQARNMLRATGWQPYSIKVGDEYYAYSRLDPIGSFLGLSADVTEIIGQVDDASAGELAFAAVTSTVQNVSSKTYMSGMAEFFDMMSSVSAEPMAPNKQAKRWIERLAGSAVPAGVAQLERTLSPELSATQGIIEKIQSRIPGWSDSLPPRRNIFGEPIVLSGGLGPDIMSPIYKSSDKHDPVAEEIVAQGTLLRMPLKNIDGVPLTTRQYDDYILFYSGQDNEAMDFLPLKDRLAEEMDSPLYIGGTNGREGLKSDIIRRVFAEYRNTAKAEMMRKYPDIKNEIDRLKLQKIMNLKGE